MVMEYQQRYDGVKDLLDRLADRLTAANLETYQSLNDVGEPIYLLNVLCADLVKSKHPITPDEHGALATQLANLTIPKGRYPYLDDPESTLAALNVVE